MGGKFTRNNKRIEVFRERRQRFLESMANDSVALFFTPRKAVRNADTDYRYRQSSDLLYLSGLQEEHAALMLRKVGKKREVIAFVREIDEHQVRWEGRMLGLKNAPAALGVTRALEVGNLAATLPDLLDGAAHLYYDIGADAANDRIVTMALTRLKRFEKRGKRAPMQIIDPSTLLHEMRLHKDAAELRLMRKAGKIAARAHSLAMQLAAPGLYEYHLQAAIEFVFAQSGAAAPSYPSIVGAGENATILHYIENNARMRSGQLVLIDAGCEYEGYASDITRTFPVNGTFSGAQRDAYQAVLDSQEAAIAVAKPGATLALVHETAIASLTQSLIDLGIVKGSHDEAIEKQKYKKYYMHGTSHWLGIDVHDVGNYRVEGQERPLEPGMVFTIEPGLYFDATDTSVPRAFRGIGIRIEDDLAITSRGHTVLTADVPKTIREVEAQCKRTIRMNDLWPN